jgi:hypothetical protein
MQPRRWAVWCGGICAIALLVSLGRAGAAEVLVSINKATQTMSVLVDGLERHHWAISSGTGGGPHDGTYRAGRMERKWFSRKYNWAPMPHSIFFDGNYAIHGTIHIKRLGRPASKGCVRLHPDNAATLFELVRANHATTTIVVSKTSHVAARAPEPEPVTTDDKAAAAAGQADESKPTPQAALATSGAPLAARPVDGASDDAVQPTKMDAPSEATDE